MTIYTDGACTGNPGPGGYCAILEHGGASPRTVWWIPSNHEQSNGADGRHQGARGPQGTRQVTLVSDSEYVVNGITKGGREAGERRAGVVPGRQSRTGNYGDNCSSSASITASRSNGSVAMPAMSTTNDVTRSRSPRRVDRTCLPIPVTNSHQHHPLHQRPTCSINRPRRRADVSRGDRHEGGGDR